MKPIEQAVLFLLSHVAGTHPDPAVTRYAGELASAVKDAAADEYTVKFAPTPEFAADMKKMIAATSSSAPIPDGIVTNIKIPDGIIKNVSVGGADATSKEAVKLAPSSSAPNTAGLVAVKP